MQERKENEMDGNGDGRGGRGVEIPGSLTNLIW